MRKIKLMEIKDPEFKCPCYTVHQHVLQIGNEPEFKHAIVHYPDTVVVLPITAEGNIVMVQQYRTAVHQDLVECPAGRIDPGETPEEAVVRELEEETGMRADNLQFIGSFYTAPGYSTESTFLYIAHGCQIISGLRECFPDEHEELGIHIYNPRAFLEGEMQVYGLKSSYLLNMYFTMKKSREMERAIDMLKEI